MADEDEQQDEPHRERPSEPQDGAAEAAPTTGAVEAVEAVADGADGDGEDPPPGVGGEPVPPSVGHVVYVPYLRAWRERLGYTRAALSARTAAPGVRGISLFTFRQVEAYGRPAKVSTVARLADALGITADDLLHVDPLKRPPPPR